jgi:hypothetical protein
MTTTNQYQRHAEGLRNLATLVDELDRFLGPLTEFVHVHSNTYQAKMEVSLFAPSKGELAGSNWHKAVLRLSDLFGEPFIVDDIGTLRARFDTPFDVQVCVWTNRRGFQPVPAQITLAEAVA